MQGTSFMYIIHWFTHTSHLSNGKYEAIIHFKSYI